MNYLQSVRLITGSLILRRSALTEWCLMETIMRKLGARPGA